MTKFTISARKFSQHYKIKRAKRVTFTNKLTIKNEWFSKELTRLEGEKRAHALALLAQREKVKQEIAQASKEQAEVNRRRELDEMFRHILKVNQECAETYLEDIRKEGLEWASEKEVEKYITEFAAKTDAMAKYFEEKYALLSINFYVWYNN